MMEHVDERLFQNTFKEMKCVLNEFWNSKIRFEKRKIQKCTWMYSSKKKLYIYPNLLGIFFSLELVIHFKFFDISKKLRWKMYIYKNKRFDIENYF